MSPIIFFFVVVVLKVERFKNSFSAFKSIFPLSIRSVVTGNFIINLLILKISWDFLFLTFTSFK
jgi:hypothetical protein